MPGFLGGPTQLTGYYGIAQADVVWGSAWPQTSSDLTMDADKYYQSVWGSNMGYVATVSPVFYAHLSYSESSRPESRARA